MNKKWRIIIGSGASIIGLALAGVSFAKLDDNEVRGGTIRIENRAESDFPALATLTPEQAVQKALDAAQGSVLKTELENENGFLVYGIEVVTADKTIMDVKVDAGSGEVLTMNRDKADDEDNESGEDGGDRDGED
ncbi:MAG: PepSY domain-containing protein [Pseudomonadota bacterium]